MLVGHTAVALMVKRVEPTISLGTYVFGALLPDLIAFPLLIAGVEHFDEVAGATLNRTVGRDIFYSHSLLMNVVWGAVLSGTYFLLRRHARGACVLFGVAVSHWLLDFISHRPDMALAPGMHWVFGLGLWNSLPATLAVEGGFWLLAIAIYARTTRPTNLAGVIAFWVWVALLSLVWYGNIHAGMDPNPIKAGVGGLIAFGLMVGWAYWINRLRPARAET